MPNTNAIAIVRRTLWTVGAFALGYAVFAFCDYRWTELVIATGLFVVLIPVDLILADTERERRLPPHGPVRKWGYRESGDRR